MKMSMKMKLFPLMAIICMVLFTSCKKDDDAFDYDQSLLYGHWKVTAQYVEGEWRSLTSIAPHVPTSASFDSDGTCWGSRELGRYSGTYSVKSNHVLVDIEGEAGLTYTIKKLSYLTCEFYVSGGQGRLYRFSRQ